jgi:nucleoside 2-deoxyribosyltransferase
MKIYLAAQFSEQALMKEWRKLLRQNGHYITSRWLEVKESGLDEAHKTNAADEAAKDLQDIKASEIVISKTINRGDMFTGGGRHIEFGYALALDKMLINVGGYESIFHKLAITVPTIEQAIEIVNEAAKAKAKRQSATQQPQINIVHP